MDRNFGFKFVFPFGGAKTDTASEVYDGGSSE